MRSGMVPRTVTYMAIAPLCHDEREGRLTTGIWDLRQERQHRLQLCVYVCMYVCTKVSMYVHVCTCVRTARLRPERLQLPYLCLDEMSEDHEQALHDTAGLHRLHLAEGGTE